MKESFRVHFCPGQPVPYLHRTGTELFCYCQGYYTLPWHLVFLLLQLLELFLMIYMPISYCRSSQSLTVCNDGQHAQIFAQLCLRIVIAANNKD